MGFGNRAGVPAGAGMRLFGRACVQQSFPRQPRWLVGWLPGWLAGWLAGWLPGWLLAGWRWLGWPCRQQQPDGQTAVRACDLYLPVLNVLVDLIGLVPVDTYYSAVTVLLYSNI